LSVSIALDRESPHLYGAREEMRVTVSCADQQVRELEVVVQWVTHGKGRENAGVHHRVRESAPPLPHTFSIALPEGPLSYDGEIVSVKWVVQARAFGEGDEVGFAEVVLRLGSVAPPGSWAPA